MRCELRHLHSPDARNLEHFTPVEPSEFGLLIQAMVGPSDGIGEESFAFVACSPAWLARRADEGGRWGRGLFILEKYDYGVIVSAVRKLCQSMEAPTWDEIAQRLAAFTSW